VPRLPYTDNGDLPAFNIFKQLNHAPKVAGAYSRMGGMLLARADLDPKLRELVINAISLELDCDYEWSHHGKWALDVGNTPDDLEALKQRDLSRLGEAERTVVEYALKVEANVVTDADIESLREIGLDEKQIVELTLTAGFYGMTARFLNAMGVEIDEGNPANFDIPNTDGTSKAREVISRRSDA
jgi:4-carboxymuconolactone decarboxylase